MVTELPSNVDYGYVVGRILQAVADSADADRYPDGLPAEGTITFTPSVAYVINASALPAASMIIPKPIVCTIDSDGYLLGPDGARGVWLVATDDEDNNPVNWTYTVSYRLTGASVPSYSIAVPMSATLDSPLHLPTVSPVISSPGIGLPAAEAAAAAAAGAATQAAASALEAAIAAQEAVDQIELGIPGPAGQIISATATGLPFGTPPSITLGGTPSSRTLGFGIPGGEDGEDGRDGIDRFLVEVIAGVYPERPDSGPVIFIGVANPDTLGLMLVGDTWIATGSEGTANWVTTVAGRSGEVILTKTDVGLNLVNNTSDLDKPVSTATAAAISAGLNNRGIKFATNEAARLAYGNPSAGFAHYVHQLDTGALWRNSGVLWEQVFPYPDTIEWTLVPAETGVISQCYVRRRSGITQVMGSFNMVSAGSVPAGTFLDLGIIPVELRPTNNILMGMSMSGNLVLQAQVSAANGKIQVRANGVTLAYTTSPNFSIAGNTW